MRARRIGRALRFAVPALAAASVCAAGGYVAASASADEPPCDEGTGVARAEPIPCDEPAPPPPTVSTTVPVEEPPPGTEPATPTTPTPGVTTTTPAPAPAEQPAPATTTASAPTLPPPTSPGTSGGTFGGGTRIARPPHSGTPTLSGGPYVFPVIGRSSFADTSGSARASVGWHHGVDIFAPPGSPVVAVADGVLFSVGWNRIGGRRLWLRDRQGNYFYYAHLSGFSPIAVEGARVRAGTVVGYLGNTGDALGTPHHLHFEIHPVSLLSLGYDGAVDPFPYVSSWRRLTDPAITSTPPRGGPGFVRRTRCRRLPARLQGHLERQRALCRIPRAHARGGRRRRGCRLRVGAARREADPAAARGRCTDRTLARPRGGAPRTERLGCPGGLRVGGRLGHEHRQRLRRRPPVPSSDLGLPRRERVRPVRASRVTRAADRGRRARARQPGVASVAGLQRDARAAGVRRRLELSRPGPRARRARPSRRASAPS